MTFKWIPQTPSDETALQRLKEHFPKPTEPPPVAWFISGKVDYFEYMTAIAPDEIPLKDLERYFSDTCAGLRNFPDVKFAVKSWKDTYHYLLPHLIQRCHEEYLLSDLIGYFFRVYPDTIPELYPKFRSDILNTLGKAIMKPVFWGEDDLSELIIQREWYGYQLYGYYDFSSTLSPAIYFCLKYLTHSEIATWCDSLFQIEGRYWHFSFMNWLFKETFTLLISTDVDDLPVSQSVKPKIKFGDNAVIDEFELPTANVRAFVEKLKEHKLYMSYPPKKDNN